VVIPAKAGISLKYADEIPAFAGMTTEEKKDKTND